MRNNKELPAEEAKKAIQEGESPSEIRHELSAGLSQLSTSSPTKLASYTAILINGL